MQFQDLPRELQERLRFCKTADLAQQAFDELAPNVPGYLRGELWLAAFYDETDGVDTGSTISSQNPTVQAAINRGILNEAATRIAKQCGVEVADVEAVEFLRQHATRNDFAQSLVSQFTNKKRLSAKQWFWVHKLAAETRERMNAEEIREPDGQTERIHPLLSRAAANLKYPTVRYENLKIGVFGPNSKYAGQVRVKYVDDAGELEYAGRIDQDGGVWLVRDAKLAGILETVLDFDSDPSGKAAISGRLTGSCCFCGRPLETKESVGVGYGPVCASNYGLPWGSTAEYDEQKANAVDAATK